MCCGAYKEWTWQSPLTVPELRERLGNATSRTHAGAVTRSKDFVGSVTQTGFQLTPLVWGHASFLPTLIGQWQEVDSSRSTIRVAVVPNTAMLMCLVILFACLGILVYEQQLARVVAITLGGAGLGFVWLKGSHLAGARVAERKLRQLAEAVPATSAEAIKSPRTPIWSWLAIGTVILAGAMVWRMIYDGVISLTDRPAVDLVYVFWITQAMVVGWLFLVSRLAPKSRLRMLTLLFLAEIGWTWCMGVDGYAGDGRPILAWRWTPTRTTNFASNASADAPSQHTEVNLAVVGPLDFAEFRGPRRDGVVKGVRIDPDWEQTPPQMVWTQPVGAGWSGFAIVGDYAITQEQRGEEEAVVCYELATGRSCWEHRDRARFHEMMGGDGPRATPTIHDGQVFALGATGILNCLDGSNGRVIWSVNIVMENSAPQSLFGMAGSPLIWRQLVIVSPGGPGTALVAYDRHSGRRVWNAGDSAAAYASPQLATIAGVEQVLSFNADGLFAHDPQDGRILWSVSWVTPPERNNVCQPVVWTDEQSRETVFISSGYDKGCALIDVSRTGNDFVATTRWRNKLLRAKFTSVVERDGFVYGLDNNMLCCLDLHTGRRCWKGGRYGFGQVLLVAEHLLVLTDEGEIVLCGANPAEHREISRFLVLHGRTWNHPALSGDRLLIRNDRLAACVKLPASLIPAQP